jgi:uncharacterized protein (DUF924 family)
VSIRIDDQAAEILHFWFIETPAAKRFARDDKIDREIELRFKELRDEVARFVSPAWVKTPERRLAAIILIDQFSRNLYREQAEAYAADDKGRLLAELAIAEGDLLAWPADRGHFVVMPLMHAEDLGCTERCLALIARHYPSLKEAIRYGDAHRDVIAKFGRYPSRNDALGRTSSQAELDYLRGGGGV